MCMLENKVQFVMMQVLQMILLIHEETIHVYKQNWNRQVQDNHL